MANTTGKKFGGRKKGTPNKKTEILLDIFQDQDFCPAEEVITILRQKKQGKFVLSEKVRAEICVRMMEFKFPKRKATEHSGEIKTGGLLAEVLEELESEDDESEKDG